jgi:hypothetical protein
VIPDWPPPREGVFVPEWATALWAWLFWVREIILRTEKVRKRAVNKECSVFTSCSVYLFRRAYVGTLQFLLTF